MNKLYWSKCAGGKNFGDCLGPALLDRAGVEYEWAEGRESNLAVCGSIVNALPNRWTGTAISVGTLYHDTRRDLGRAVILGVRGKGTIKSCSLPRNMPMGDLGLLADRLLDGEHDKEIETLLVPHYADKKLEAVFPALPVQSLTAPVKTIIRRIASSERIVSSSLHACIVADTLGVEHMWWPSQKVAGGSWKFDDYVSAFGLEEFSPKEWRLTDRDSLGEVKADLGVRWDSLCRELR